MSFLVEDGHSTPERHASASAVGVDRGVTVAVACSDATMRDREFRTLGELGRYRRLQQRLARQRRDSANRAKTLAAMHRIRWRERDRRHDFVSWTASRLATRHGVVVLEELKTPT